MINWINYQTNPFRTARSAKKTKQKTEQKIEELLAADAITESEKETLLDEINSHEGYWRNINGSIPVINEQGGKNYSSIYKWFGIILMLGGIAAIIEQNMVHNQPVFAYSAYLILGIICFLGNRKCTLNRVLIGCVIVQFVNIFSMWGYSGEVEWTVFSVLSFVALGIYTIMDLAVYVNSDEKGETKIARRILLVCTAIAVIFLAWMPLNVATPYEFDGVATQGYVFHPEMLLPFIPQLFMIIALLVLCISRCIFADGFGEDKYKNLDCVIIRWIEAHEERSWQVIGFAVLAVILVLLLLGCVRFCSYVASDSPTESNDVWYDENGNGQEDKGEHMYYEYKYDDGHTETDWN